MPGNLVTSCWLLVTGRVLPETSYQKPATRNGFTLVEILIVIAIIGLVSVVAIPNLRNYVNGQAATNTAQDMIRLIRQAQTSSTSGTLCSTGQLPVYWNFVLSNSTYSNVPHYINGATDTPCATVSSVNIPSGTGFAISSNTGVCSGSTLIIQFTNGRASFPCDPNASSVTIQVNVSGSASSGFSVNKAGSVY
jgi:prepilin-type N-terminal cleavage/methylation domain-containing protein